MKKQPSTLPGQIFDIRDQAGFDRLALDVFAFQYARNPVYAAWCKALGRNPSNVQGMHDIPFLPISFFKSHEVVAFEGDLRMVFSSSGTTGSSTSRHFVADPQLYEKSFLEAFRIFYGEPGDYCILALLPGYLERSGSSLVYMAQKLIERSGHPLSGFYLHNLEKLSQHLQQLMNAGQKVLLLGVSFALLDMAEQYPIKLENTIVMETGGMKGRRREMIRGELHQVLCRAFGLESIHSEYGMTELLSQAYSTGEGVFQCPPWMRVLIRDSNDPLTIGDGMRAGGINVIDLANLYSCSFIATEDLGRIHPNGHFEVLGRFDHSDVRGCNLMVE
jgi:phenylacetate-coenzyme A ligase PaaK-like adenylate-forming protein